MRSLFLFIFLTLGLISTAQDNGIRFSPDTLLSSALKKAKADNRLIFIDCFTTWCGPCKNMDKQVYTDDEVGKFFNRNFINVKFDMEKSEGLKIKNSYEVNAYPTFLFLNSKGEKVYYAVGYFDSEPFINIGQNALNANLKILTKKVESTKRTPNDIYSFLLANPRYTKKDSLMNIYYSMILPENRISIESWTLFDRFVTDINCDFYKYFISNRNLFENEYGIKKVSDKLVYSFMTYSDKYRKDKDKMQILWKIDSVIVTDALFRNSVNYAIEDCENDQTNKALWDTLISATNIKYVYNSIYDLYYGASYICGNYRTFNDTVALKNAKQWALKFVTLTPEADYFNDVYAHILFELGDTKEAIKYEELAITQAKESNSIESANKYTLELDRFKTKFNRDVIK